MNIIEGKDIIETIISVNHISIIPYQEIKIIKKIGSGGEGNVYKAAWNCKKVAVNYMSKYKQWIRTPKPTSSAATIAEKIRQKRRFIKLKKITSNRQYCEKTKKRKFRFRKFIYSLKR